MTKLASTAQLSKGTPAWQPDLEDITSLAALGCSYLEIASHHGVSLSLIKKRAATDEEFAAAIALGKSKGAVKLRKMQWDLAASGNSAMLIFLGKQLLGQSQTAGDNSEPAVEVANPRDRFLPRAETIPPKK